MINDEDEASEEDSENIDEPGLVLPSDRCREKISKAESNH